ncbi:MAG: glycosyl hydrolase family 28-related protein [Draconibacterium sp.]
MINNYTSEDLQQNLDKVKFSDVPYTGRFTGRVQGTRDGEVKMDYEAPSKRYEVKSFSQGLHLENTTGDVVKRYFGVEVDESPLETPGEFPQRDEPAFPSQTTWVNIQDLGAVGDGKTDCTEVFRRAIARYETIYIPMGRYLLSGTLELKPKTTLIGFHPYMTELVLKDKAPGFSDPDNCQPLIITPEHGANGISGIGFNLGFNPSVAGFKWMAGPGSYLNDGHFRGNDQPGSIGVGQRHSIWVTNGGCGIFKNLWILDRRTSVPFLINNTTAPGKIYEVSIEHHQNVELQLERVENWDFYALQLEEDRGCEKTLGIYIKDCKHLRFANFRSHRTSGVWEPYFAGIQIRNSHDITIRGNNMRGAVFPWDNAVFDEISGMLVSHRFFTKLSIK